MLINSPIEPLVELSESARWSTLARMVFNCSIVPWLDLMTSERLGVSLVLSSAPFCTGGPVAVLLLMSTTVSPRTPMVSRLDVESVRTASLYLAPILNVTSTGVSLRAGTMPILVTVPDRVAFEVDRSTLLEAGGILKIGAQDDLSL